MSNRPNRSRRAPASSRPQDDTRKRTLLIVGAVVLLVVFVGVIVALGSAEDDPDDAPDFGPIATQGEALPELPDSGDDPAVGSPAPRLEGTNAEGTPVRVGQGGEPTIVFFLAHWCPHCQSEVPEIVGLLEDGELDGVRVVGVLTGTDRAAPNHPPVAWLERESWTGDVILDDEQGTAARAYGLSGYPFAVYLDADGVVVARTSGGVGAAGIAQRAEAIRGDG
ncbi:MAG: TlpA family protein disulfide reductase [Actinomycetota bacterium]